MSHSPDWDEVSRDDVMRAIQEYDRLGPDQFFAQHGFARTTTYELICNDRSYPPKALLGTAYEFATGRRLASGDFEGGKAGAVHVLGKAGVHRPADPSTVRVRRARPTTRGGRVRDLAVSPGGDRLVPEEGASAGPSGADPGRNRGRGCRCGAAMPPAGRTPAGRACCSSAAAAPSRNQPMSASHRAPIVAPARNCHNPKKISNRPRRRPARAAVIAAQVRSPRHFPQRGPQQSATVERAAGSTLNTARAMLMPASQEKVPGTRPVRPAAASTPATPPNTHSAMPSTDSPLRIATTACETSCARRPSRNTTAAPIPATTYAQDGLPGYAAGKRLADRLQASSPDVLAPLVPGGCRRRRWAVTRRRVAFVVHPARVARRPFRWSLDQGHQVREFGLLASRAVLG